MVESELFGWRRVRGRSLTFSSGWMGKQVDDRGLRRMMRSRKGNKAIRDELVIKEDTAERREVGRSVAPRREVYWHPRSFSAPTEPPPSTERAGVEDTFVGVRRCTWSHRLSGLSHGKVDAPIEPNFDSKSEGAEESKNDAHVNLEEVNGFAAVRVPKISYATRYFGFPHIA